MKKCAATGFSPWASTTIRSLSTSPLPSVGEPVAQHVRGLASWAGSTAALIASPDHIWHRPYCPAGISVYIEIVTFGPHRLLHVEQLVRISAMSLGVGGVDVVIAVAQQHHRHRGVPVVEDRDVAGVLRVPEHVVRVVQPRDVGWRPCRCASRCRSCRSCRARCSAQPRSYQGSRKLRPQVARVGEVVVVERAQQVRLRPACPASRSSGSRCRT